MNQPLTWIDVNLDHLIQNYQAACSLTDATVTCVLKANAYGHGLLMTASALQEAGCQSFGVSCAREAIVLRQGGIQGHLHVMTPSLPQEIAPLIRLGVTLTAAAPEGLAETGAAAKALGRRALVDIKVDTGFHRLGIPPTAEAANAMGDAYRQHAAQFEQIGLFSHLGLIDEAHDVSQADKFRAMRDMLIQAGLPIAEMHLCDSIGLVRYPAFHFDRVRVGALLYGARPFHSEHLPFPCLETLSFHARVTQVRHVPAGEPVGYGEAPLPRDARIATVSAGYGDGYLRCLSNGQGKVMIRGSLAPVVGLVCMDQMMVDVTDLPDVTPGDVATLLGGGIPYADVAAWAHTNRNECMAQLSSRPIRRYWQGGQIIHIQDELLDARRDASLT